MSDKMTGIERIAAERQRQIDAEGWAPVHDDKHDLGELAWAAVCYAAPTPVSAERMVAISCSCREAICEHAGGVVMVRRSGDPWPWDGQSDKRKKHSRLRQLEIAGALIAAEIDRLQRAEDAHD